MFEVYFWSIQPYTIRTRSLPIYCLCVWASVGGWGRPVIKHCSQVIVEHLDNAYEWTCSSVDRCRDCFSSFQFLWREFGDHHEVSSGSTRFPLVHQSDCPQIETVDILHRSDFEEKNNRLTFVDAWLRLRTDLEMDHGKIRYPVELVDRSNEFVRPSMALLWHGSMLEAYRSSSRFQQWLSKSKERVIIRLRC